MQIRKLQQHDLADLLQLYTHLHSTDLPLPPPEVIAAEWQQILANPSYRYFGGFIDAQLVSSCTLTVIPNLTRGCAPYGVIENVVTDNKHRRQGFGTALLKHALAAAWAAGCYKVMLLTGRKDKGTLEFYEAAGFDGHEKQAFIAKP